MNRYPAWKYILMLGMLLIGILYALPNIYGTDPAVQISKKDSTPVTATALNQLETALKNNQLPYLSAKKEGDDLLIRFDDTDLQLKASDAIKASLGDDYVVALNLAPRTPHWLQVLGANPMKLGLDLRGGIHLLLDVDVDSVIKARQQGEIRNLTDTLRSQNIRYTAINAPSDKNLVLQFRDQNNLSRAYSYLPSRFPDYTFTKQDLTIQATLTDAAIQAMEEYAIEQTMTILTNRVNELGVSEATVQQQGTDQISVDLPGIQDTARAKDLLGKTATLRFQLVDTTHDVQSAVAGNVPFGSKLYQYEGRPILLQDQVILRGDSITYATATFGEDGRPAVQIRLGGGSGESLFSQVTGQNIGQPLAVVYVETQMQTKQVDGKSVTIPTQTEQVISVATIQNALGSNFQITGLESPKYAQNLALLLRSGSLVAPTNIVQERLIGPSLGKANIYMGVRSVIISAILVILFMAIYYQLFGLIADVALMLNIIFIMALLSILGATLTLPGLAGIVLTVGMAVDANVLINERIREELRLGMGPQASIKAGYDRAFATIVDSNVTTLIVAMILFALGSGAVKAFAVTLSLGILSSMITAIFFTRGLVNWIYGSRNVKKLSIGIKLESKIQDSGF